MPHMLPAVPTSATDFQYSVDMFTIDDSTIDDTVWNLESGCLY